MGTLRVDDSSLSSMVATADDLASSVRGIDDGNAIRKSNDGIVNGGLGATAEKAANNFEDAVEVFAKRLETYAKATKKTADDFASADQANAAVYSSAQQKLV